MVAEGDTGGATIEKPRVVKAKIDRIRINTDPQIDVFEITLTRQADKGEWRETFGSEREVEIFLRGVTAGCVQSDWHTLEEMELPREPTRYGISSKKR